MLLGNGGEERQEGRKYEGHARTFWDVHYPDCGGVFTGIYI